jgi:hypothetical protein
LLDGERPSVILMTQIMQVYRTVSEKAGEAVKSMKRAEGLLDAAPLINHAS